MRNLQLLNEIRKKLPVDDMNRTLSPFEVQVPNDVGLHYHQQMVVATAKQFDTVSVDSSSFIENIQKRAQTAEASPQSGQRPRRRVIEYL